MRKVFLLLIAVLTLNSCKNEIECCVNFQPITVSLKFIHSWDATPILPSEFNQFKLVTENGETISIERLRYLLSNIRLINGDENYTFSNYTLIDVSDGNEFTLNLPESLVAGSYQLKFTFGFSDEDNQDGIYQDLNSVNFNVPGMLGGGYHYMQFDGKYKDPNNTDANFNYHAIRAVDTTDPNNLVFQDTSFEVDLGTLSFINDSEIIIKVNIAEWFKNPNTWNLNELNTMLMPNFEAQKQISENGETVFTLGDIN